MTTLSEQQCQTASHYDNLQVKDQKPGVFDKHKDITRRINMMPKKRFTINVYIDYENAYYLTLQFEDDYGCYTEQYYFPVHT